MSYHARNTIPVEELKAGKQLAAHQEELIRQILERYPDRDFTPFEMMHLTEALGHRWEINGVRRAMTNLANEGLARKTGNRRIGDKGVTNCCWTWLGQPLTAGQMRLQL